MFNNDSIGFKKRVDYLTKYGTDRYERDRPDWVSGYEHFENDKWYTYLAKGTYNTFIGDYLNPDPVLEGEVPTVSEGIDYWGAGINNIYNKTNYNSMINGSFSKKEKNVAKAIIIRNSFSFGIDMSAIFLFIILLKIKVDLIEL